MPPSTDSTARVAGDLIPAAQHHLQIDACHDLKKSAIDSFSTALRRRRPPTYPDPRSSEFLLDARSEIRRRHGVQLVTERAHGLLEPSEAGVLRFALGIEARKRLQIPGRQSNANQCQLGPSGKYVYTGIKDRWQQCCCRPQGHPRQFLW